LIVLPGTIIVDMVGSKQVSFIGDQNYGTDS